MNKLTNVEGLPAAVVCEVCGARMQDISSWVKTCKTCGYQKSTLTPSEGTGIPGLEELRRENYEDLLDRLEATQRIRGQTLLEVGSAWGWFLEAAARRGAVVHGIEPERANAATTRAKGFAVENGFFPDDLQAKGPYDLIVFNDVFEHLPNPSAAIRHVEDLLAPGGLAVINYPSSSGTLFHIATLMDKAGMEGPLERLWQKGLASPHVSYFNPKNIRLLVSRHTSMEHEQTFPLKSVSREGLITRVSASHTGLTGGLMVAALWGLSYLLPHLPEDIQVSIFRKNK